MTSRHGYSTRQVAAFVGLPPARIVALARAGVLRSRRGARGELRFEFAEVSLLRSLRGLQSCPPARLGAAVRNLERLCDRGRPLAAFRVEADGKRVVARDELGSFDAGSGQALLPFEPVAGTPARADVVQVRRPADGEAWFVHGVRLEATAAAEASAAYERALALDPTHVGACVNLGRLRHLAGDASSAVDLYERALAAAPDEPTALFNLGVALEDLGRTLEALAAYERAVDSDPRLADAHYNAARLCERRGDHLGAVRHMRHYRALSP